MPFLPLLFLFGRMTLIAAASEREGWRQLAVDSPSVVTPKPANSQ